MAARKPNLEVLVGLVESIAETMTVHASCPWCGEPWDDTDPAGGTVTHTADCELGNLLVEVVGPGVHLIEGTESA